MATELPPAPPPLLPAAILHRLVNLDITWSVHLHTVTGSVVPRAVLKLLELTGDGRFWFPISISLFLSPLSLHSLHLYRTFLGLLIGSLLDLLVIGLIKHLVRRPRPVYNKNMHRTFSVDHWSFPSGHASRVCFIAAFFYLSIGEIVDGLVQLKQRKGEIVDRWIGDTDAVQCLRSKARCRSYCFEPCIKLLAGIGFSLEGISALCDLCHFRHLDHCLMVY
ncbi:hypothetical protein Dimus_008912 [Dionaea muscipula]